MAKVRFKASDYKAVTRFKAEDFRSSETDNSPLSYARDFYSGMTRLASSVAKSPALLHTIANKTGRMLSDPVGAMQYNEAPPEMLYKNALTKTLDESAAKESYMDERWHSKGQNLSTLVKNKKLEEIPSYLAHAIVANSPQQIATVVATMSGLGTPALLALGGSVASETYAKGIKEGKDTNLALTHALASGGAEVLFERVGTMQVTKNLQKTLAKHLGKEAAERVTKEAFFEISGGIVKGMAAEGIDEAATSLVQGASGNITGVDKKSVGDILADTFESGVIGALSSAATTTTITTGEQMVKAKIRDRRNKYIAELGGTNIIELGDNVAFEDTTGNIHEIRTDEASRHNIKMKLDPKYKDTWDAQELYIADSNTRDNNTQIATKKYQGMIKELDGDVKQTDEELYYAADFIENPDVLDMTMEQTEKSVLERKRGQMTADQYLEELDRIENQYAASNPTVKEELTRKDPEMLASMEKAKARLETDQGFINTLMVIMNDLANKGQSYVDERVLNRTRSTYVPHSYMTLEQFNEYDKNKLRLDHVKFRHQRLYDTLAQARVFGNRPLRRTMTGNYEAYVNRMNNAVLTKKFKNTLLSSDLVTTRPNRDYVALGDDSTFTDNHGYQLYARKDVAKEVNAIFSDTPYRKNGFLHGVRKVNAISKNIRLLTGLFHHAAFGTAYLGGTPISKLVERTLERASKGDLKGAFTAFQEDINWIPYIGRAYKHGLAIWEENGENVELLIRNNLTLGRIQDWDERIVREANILSKLADKNKLTKASKNKIVEAHKGFTDFLFGKLGAGLKVKAALFIMQDHMERNPGISADQAAKHTAEIVNNNFGGLHLKAMRRNPTAQYIWQTFTFAPDWTESNFRFYSKAFLSDDATSKQLHKRTMTGMLTKYMIATVSLNLLMAAMREPDDEERERKSTLLENFMKGYNEAWQDGKLNWMRVNVSPFLQKFGAKDTFYYNVAGFFLDPTKWLSRDIQKGGTVPEAIIQSLTPERLVRSFAKSVYYKSSAVPQMFADLVMDTDYTFWRGFTNFNQLVDEKKMTDWDDGLKGKMRIKPIGLSQAPSYLAYEAQKFIPIQVNSAIHYALGELSGQEALLKGLGQDVKRGYRVKD